MSARVVPFEARHAEPAAALLATAHASTAAERPDLDIADAPTALSRVHAWYGTGPGTAAVAGDVLHGFMSATVTGFPNHPQARVRIQQHAVRTDADARLTYRRLYQALSARLVAVGCFDHSITATAAHAETVGHLVELGFGYDQVKGVRTLTTPPRVADGVRVREAVPADLAQLLRLSLELQHFHAEAPMLRPALIDLRAYGADLHAAVTDDARLVLVAEPEGESRALGLMVADPDNRFTGTATIGVAAVTAEARAKGVGSALLAGVVDWAARRGFQRCGVEWTSSNLVSDPFWRGHGFVPVAYTLNRRVDPRVAWADARLDYRDLYPGRSAN